MLQILSTNFLELHRHEFHELIPHWLNSCNSYKFEKIGALISRKEVILLVACITADPSVFEQVNGS